MRPFFIHPLPALTAVVLFLAFSQSCGHAPPAIVTFNDALERFPHDRVDSVKTPDGLEVTYQDLKWPNPKDSSLSLLQDEERYRTRTTVTFDDAGNILRILGTERIYTITDTTTSPPLFTFRDSVIMDMLPEE